MNRYMYIYMYMYKLRYPKNIIFYHILYMKLLDIPSDEDQTGFLQGRYKNMNQMSFRTGHFRRFGLNL